MLGDQVYRAIKEDISCSARVGRDELLLEQALAERARASQRRPSARCSGCWPDEGLLRVLPRKGYMLGALRPVGIQDVVEVFELRRILELPLCAEAARRRTPEQLARMEESLEIERHLRDPSLEEMERSLGLHLLIAEATGNDRAIAMVRSLMDDAARIPRPYSRSSPPGPRRPGVEEHARIVAAIASGDAGEASAAMLSDLEATIARDGRPRGRWRRSLSCLTRFPTSSSTTR